MAFFVPLVGMKKFDIPEHYRSSIIGKVKARRKTEDPRKQDFSPSRLNFGNVEFIIPRHFGFCYGVENAIEKSYKALNENPEKNIYLLSQMIHNPLVNKDLQERGIQFLQDTEGNQLIPWNDLSPQDIVIIPAFGTTLETESILRNIGLDIEQYNTTCPFVEKVWNRSAHLGNQDYTIIIHGKAQHEETKATFSHSKATAPSLMILNMTEAAQVADYILGRTDLQTFIGQFENKMSANFDPDKHLERIGVVNQTTMLASETQEISDFLKQTMIQKFGEDNYRNHFADTRDTLCYATNDNQTSTIQLLDNEADFALVIGGYNSSNTSHLVELLEQKFPVYYIQDHREIVDQNTIHSYDIHKKQVETHNAFLPQKELTRIIITSGASCPDSAVDEVIVRILMLCDTPLGINDIVI